jgi:hypothetical protein
LALRRKIAQQNSAGNQTTQYKGDFYSLSPHI